MPANWLINFGYPSRRLPEKAEQLVLFSALAQQSERAGSPLIGRIQSKDVALNSSHKARAESRKLVHFRCDNSAKV